MFFYLHLFSIAVILCIKPIKLNIIMNVMNDKDLKKINATISLVKKYGFFVNFNLDNKKVSGFVHISEIDEEFNKASKVLSRLQPKMNVILELLEYQNDTKRYLLSWKNIPKYDRCLNYLIGKGTDFKNLKLVTDRKIIEYKLKAIE